MDSQFKQDMLVTIHGYLAPPVGGQCLDELLPIIRAMIKRRERRISRRKQPHAIIEK